MLAKLQKRRAALGNESGFTLIELLVVLIIIGVLLAIAVPSYLGFKDRAERRSAQANVRSEIPSAEAWFEDGATPTSTYTGLNLAAITGIDAASKLSAAAPESVAGGTANAFCLQAQSSDGKYTAYVYGPAMTGVNVNGQPVDGNVYVVATTAAPACP